MDLSGSKSLEQSGIASRRTGRSDPVVGSGLREVQHRRAVDEHRGAALFEVELACIHFGEMREKLCFKLPIPDDELL